MAAKTGGRPNDSVSIKGRLLRASRIDFLKLNGELAGGTGYRNVSFLSASTAIG